MKKAKKKVIQKLHKLDQGYVTLEIRKKDFVVKRCFYDFDPDWEQEKIFQTWEEAFVEFTLMVHDTIKEEVRRIKKELKKLEMA